MCQLFSALSGCPHADARAALWQRLAVGAEGLQQSWAGVLCEQLVPPCSGEKSLPGLEVCKAVLMLLSLHSKDYPVKHTGSCLPGCCPPCTRASFWTETQPGCPCARECLLFLPSLCRSWHYSASARCFSSNSQMPGASTGARLPCQHCHKSQRHNPVKAAGMKPVLPAQITRLFGRIRPLLAKAQRRNHIPVLQVKNIN